MPTLDRDGDVFVLDIGDTENRFHPDWLAAVHAALDEVERAEGAHALVTTASGKFFSNGLDLDWLSAHGDQARELELMVDYGMKPVQALRSATSVNAKTLKLADRGAVQGRARPGQRPRAAAGHGR